MCVIYGNMNRKRRTMNNVSASASMSSVSASIGRLWGLLFLLQPGLAKVDINENNQATDCSFTFNSVEAKNGTFSSPFYPQSYPKDLTCRFKFEGRGRERVQINFTDLDLNYPAGDPKEPYDCEDVDSVTVSVEIDGERVEIGVYCGKKLPPMLMSNGDKLEVTFTSRSAESTTKGFSATYSFVKDFGIRSGEQNHDMVCGFMYRSKSSPNGTFTSPNYPGLYPRNAECHYLFYGESNERVYIKFPYFDVEGISPACVENTQSDYVEFSNFNVELKDRKMTRFCGNKDEQPQESVESDANFFRVTFKSNDVYDATGFRAEYEFRKWEENPDPRPTAGVAALHIHTLSSAAVLFAWTTLLYCLHSSTTSLLS